MHEQKITTRYATHPGSNVGDILARGAGKEHRRRIDQSTSIEDNHRAAALTLAERIGIPTPSIVGEPDDTRRGDTRYFIWTVAEGRPWAEAVARMVTAYEVTYVGTDQDDDGWNHDAWSCKFTHTSGRTMRVDYRTGLGHRQTPTTKGGKPRTDRATGLQLGPEPTKPPMGDVLSSYLEDGRGTTPDAVRGFEDWAANYGYDTDSRRAEQTYRACQQAWSTLTTWAGVDDRDALVAALDAGRDADEI